jgi:hypothetical protein
VTGVYGAIDSHHAGKGYSLKFLWQCIALDKVTGYKAYYGRASNIYTRKILQQLGAEVVKECELVDGDVREKFWLMKIDLAKTTFTYSKLK